jgi:hypothetical protein
VPSLVPSLVSGPVALVLEGSAVLEVPAVLEVLVGDVSPVVDPAVAMVVVLSPSVPPLTPPRSVQPPRQSMRRPHRPDARKVKQIMAAV